MRADDAIDTVLAAPPRQFVSIRNRVAAELKQSGDTATAARVRAMRRPSASVWAVNQLAHREADAIEELLAAGARLVSAQQRAIAGDGGGLLEDARAERQHVGALARRAEAILAEAGQRADATTTRRIAQTLHAAAVADDDTRETLRAGRLLADLEPPSELGVLAGAPAPAENVHAARSHPAGPRSAHARPHPAAAERKHEHTAATAQAKRAGAHAAPESRHGRAQSAAASRRERAAAAAASKRQRAEAALAKKRARAEAAAARKRERAEAAAARRRHAELAHAATAAERNAAAQRRAVDKARAEVERAEQKLRVAKDALAAAELAAHNARRAADESD